MSFQDKIFDFVDHYLPFIFLAIAIPLIFIIAMLALTYEKQTAIQSCQWYSANNIKISDVPYRCIEGDK